MDEKLTPPEEGPRSAGDTDAKVKVTDRRKFDKDGRLRADANDEDTVDSTDAGVIEPEPTPESPGRRPATAAGVVAAEPADAGPAATAGQETVEKTPPAHDPGGEGRRGVDFQSFVYFLYMSALHELGVPTDQGAPPGQPDLERARFFIDVLHVLEEKTRGNLQPGEAKLLEDVLYNLRMQYVGLAQQDTPS